MPKPLHKNDRDFFRFARFGTAAGFAFMAVVFSSFDSSREPSVQITIWTILWAVVGAAGGYLFWIITERFSEKQRARTQVPGKKVTHLYFFGLSALFFALALVPLLPAKWRPASAGVGAASFMVAVVFFLMKQLDNGEED